MSRKRKKKKEKLLAGSADADWTTTDLDRGGDEENGTLRSQTITSRLMQDRPNSPGQMARTPEMNKRSTDEWGGSVSNYRPDPPRGLFGKLKRWFGGSNPTPAEKAPAAYAPGEPAFFVGKPEMPRQDTQAERTAGTAAAKGAAPSSPTGRGGPGVDQVHAVLMLEQVLPELEAARRQLVEEREAAHIQFVQLEGERDQALAAAERARNERNEIEQHTNVIRKSVTALERQLQEERAAAAKQVEELEAERDRVRSERGILEARIRSLEDDLKSGGASDPKLQAAIAEGRTERERLESLLQSVRGELEEARQQTQQDEGSAEEQIHRLEAEVERRIGVGEQSRVERARIEERAGMVQKALEVLEQQLRDEREAASSQIQQLEADRDKSRARCLELEERVGSLAEEKEAAQRRPRKKKDGTDANVAELETELEESRALTAKFEARIKSLEDELATAHQQALQERQTAASRVEQLEAALNEARDQARRSESKLSAAPAGGTRTPGLSSEAVESLYHQSMSRLTVLLACADIVLMNPELEPSVRQTSQEIKTQGQALLDVIKSFTVPPESQQGH
jgi:hypothetical protein